MCLKIQFRSVVSDSLRPHGLQHPRLPCPSLSPRAYPNSCPLSRWYHPTISSSVIPFSSCLQSFLASGSFQMSQFFASGGQSIGISALTWVLPMNTQNWSPVGWTGWIFLQSKGLSTVFSNTTVQKHQFLGTEWMDFKYLSHFQADFGSWILPILTFWFSDSPSEERALSEIEKLMIRPYQCRNAWFNFKRKPL